MFSFCAGHWNRVKTQRRRRIKVECVKIDRNKIKQRIRRLIRRIKKKMVHKKNQARKVQGVGLNTFNMKRIKRQQGILEMIQEKQL